MFEWTNLIPPIIGAAFGGILTFGIGRFLNRTSVVTYSMTQQLISPHIKDGILGNIEIFLSGRKIDKLKFVTVGIENESNSDFENVIVKFSVNRPNVIQGSEGYLDDKITWLEYSDKFGKINNETNIAFNSYIDTTPITDPEFWSSMPAELTTRVNYVTSNREYLIPALNRDRLYGFNFLIEETGDLVDLNISIVHKGIKLKIAKEEQNKNIETIITIAIIGLIISAIILWALIEFLSPPSVTLIIVSAIIGATYSIFGAAVLLLYNFIKSFFD